MMLKQKISCIALLLSVVFLSTPAAAESVIKGTVQDQQGKPLSGITVTASNGGCSGTYYETTITNTRGEFTLRLVDKEGVAAPEDVFLNTGKELKSAYAAVTYLNTQGGSFYCSDAESIFVPKNTTKTGVKVVALQGGTVSGIVRGLNRKPVKGVKISFRTSCSDNSTVLSTVETEENGEFISDVLPTGDVFAFADTEGVSLYYGNQYWIESGFGVQVCEAADAISISSKRNTGGINFNLQNSGAISGKVIDAAGSPVSGAYIIFSTDPCGKDRVALAETAADGTYIKGGLPVGMEVYLNTRSSDVNRYYLDRAWTSSGGTSNCLQGEAVMITARTTQTDINFELGLSGAITGKVLDYAGNPVAGVVVEAYSKTCRAGGDWLADAVTAADGSYVMTGVPEGDVFVDTLLLDELVSNSTYFVERYWDGGVGTRVCEDAKSIPIQSTQTFSEVNFTLGLSGSVSGHLIDVNGLPVRGVIVSAYDNICGGNRLSSAESAEDGSFTLKGIESSFVFIVADDAAEFSPWWISGWFGNGVTTFNCQEAAAVGVILNDEVGGYVIQLTAVNDYVTAILQKINKLARRATRLVKSGNNRRLANIGRKINREIALLEEQYILIEEVFVLKRSVRRGIRRKNVAAWKNVQRRTKALLRQYR